MLLKHIAMGNIYIIHIDMEWHEVRREMLTKRFWSAGQIDTAYDVYI